MANAKIGQKTRSASKIAAYTLPVCGEPDAMLDSKPFYDSGSQT